jgi:hypothetical protein
MFRSWRSFFFGKVMRKIRFRKFTAGIYHTIKKKREIDICTRISYFAKRTVGFRPLWRFEKFTPSQVLYVTGTRMAVRHKHRLGDHLIVNIVSNCQSGPRYVVPDYKCRGPRCLQAGLIHFKKRDLPVFEINQKRMAAATRLTSRRITLWPLVAQDLIITSQNNFPSYWYRRIASRAHRGEYLINIK